MGRKCEALLVLDDYHVISTEAIHQDMAFLLEHLPPHLHLIISTRNDPPFPLPRLRVSDRLLELRAADLRFSREEIAVFFARQAEITLSAEEIVGKLGVKSRTQALARIRRLKQPLALSSPG